MAQKSSLAVAGAAAAKPTASELVPNRDSEGLKLAISALKDGIVVSTGDMSKDEYIAWSVARIKAKQ